MSREQIKLKPCPFCGGEATLKQNFAGQFAVYCEKCECIYWGGNSRNKASVYNAWNRRADNEQRAD